MGWGKAGGSHLRAMGSDGRVLSKEVSLSDQEFQKFPLAAAMGRRSRNEHGATTRLTQAEEGHGEGQL